MNENWYTTIGGFLFLVTMLVLIFWGIDVPPTPPKAAVVKSEISEMAEATYRRNAELDKLAREK